MVTEKQRRFAEHYAVSGNGTQAARKAGYAAKNDQVLAQVARSNLRSPGVVELIETLRPTTPDVADRLERARWLTAVMRGEAKVNGEPPTIADRLRAIHLLGKMHGDFVQRVEHSGRGGGPVEVTQERVDRSCLTRMTPEQRKRYRALLEELQAVMSETAH